MPGKGNQAGSGPGKAPSDEAKNECRTLSVVTSRRWAGLTTTTPSRPKQAHTNSTHHTPHIAPSSSEARSSNLGDDTFESELEPRDVRRFTSPSDAAPLPAHASNASPRPILAPPSGRDVFALDPSTSVSNPVASASSTLHFVPYRILGGTADVAPLRQAALPAYSSLSRCAQPNPPLPPLLRLQRQLSPRRQDHSPLPNPRSPTTHRH